MAYDPKKKRPAKKSLDSVVDEIFGEEELDSKSKKASDSDKKKTSSQKKSTTSLNSKKTPNPKPKSAGSKASNSSKTKESSKSESQEFPDNVLPLYPETKDAPLVTQPQVWIATGIAALLVLVIARKRRKRK